MEKLLFLSFINIEFNDKDIEKFLNEKITGGVEENIILNDHKENLENVEKNYVLIFYFDKKTDFEFVKKKLNLQNKVNDGKTILSVLKK